MNAASPPSWRSDVAAERRNRTREKLIAAAARVVSELGEARARIEDFAAAAGISRGSFYNHYSTREELLADLWARVGSEPFHDIQRQSHSIEDTAERLATEARLILQRAMQDPVWGWVVYSLSATDKVPQDLLSFPRRDLVIGHHEGRFQFPNLDCAVDMVVSALRRALRATLEEARDGEYAAGLIQMLLLALGLNRDEARAIAARAPAGLEASENMAPVTKSRRGST